LPNGSPAPGLPVGPAVVTANRTYAVQVGTVVPVGNPSVDPSIDFTVGGMFVGQELSAGGRLATWTVFSGAYEDSRNLTPLIFRKEGSDYRLVGIGRTREILPGLELSPLTCNPVPT
jgi:hypothetical protein